MKTLKEIPCGKTVKVTKLTGEGPDRKSTRLNSSHMA